MGKRRRRIFSVKEELLKKSREAALTAVQVFNNPGITFKAETYIVLMVIAWTYLLHAIYRRDGVDYRYYEVGSNGRKRYDKTKAGAFKHWELERCLSEPTCPLSSPMSSNLRFLIGLRHEIEHQMTTRIDDLLSARFQACCLNFHEVIEAQFGAAYGIAKHLAVSLQFTSISREQIDSLADHPGLPAHIKSFVEGFDGRLQSDDFASPKFAYRVIFVPKTVNHPSQADQVISFVKADSPIAQSVNAQYTVIKETERQKFRPTRVVQMMRDEGFLRFNAHHHAELWKAQDAKATGKGFGVQVEGYWYWYETWVAEVRKHCLENKSAYS